MTKRIKRPRDPIALAKLVGDIATGQVEEGREGAAPATLESARRGGVKGGPARAAKLAPERRTEIAQKAAKTRWARAKRAK